MKVNLSPLLVSIMFRIGGEDGHAYTYNKSVGEAVRGLGWEHRAAVHAGCTVRQLPPGWQVCLATLEHRRVTIPLLFGRTVIPDLGSLRRAVGSLAGCLQAEILPQQRRTILFMEFFTVTDLIILALALARVPRGRLAVCLLYRMEVHRQPTRRVYDMLNRLLRWQVGAERFTLLSDSRPLAQSLGALFRQPVQVVPIPHAAPPVPAAVKTTPSETARPTVMAWWPGRPAPEKGLQVMLCLAQQTGAAAEQAEIVVAASSGLKPKPGGCQVRLISDELSSAEYWGWMLAADLILLPYDLSYAERTSGIFIEAIAAGKPAAVTAGTWMAGELLTHGLAELIVDWSSPDVWQRLVWVARNADLRPRLATMQVAYLREHSQQGYAAALQVALASSTS